LRATFREIRERTSKSETGITKTLPATIDDEVVQS
jgi:hypothetical protein